MVDHRVSVAAVVIMWLVVLWALLGGCDGPESTRRMKEWPVEPAGRALVARFIGRWTEQRAGVDAAEVASRCTDRQIPRERIVLRWCGIVGLAV